jgi:hypothetical protein
MAEKVVGIPKPVAELAHAQLLAFEGVASDEFSAVFHAGTIAWDGFDA